MHELCGIDYYWYCVDKDGQIAVMLTAGMAPIPVTLLRNLPGNNELRRHLLQLPAWGGYQIGIRDYYVKGSSGAYVLKSIGEKPIPDDSVAKELYGDFFEHASQGIFGYDWLDIHRIKIWESNKYELIARPTKPLLVHDLPVAMQNLILPTKLGNLSFSDNNLIDIAAHLDCD